MAEKNVSVRLTADTAQYTAAMSKAAAASKGMATTAGSSFATVGTKVQSARAGLEGFSTRALAGTAILSAGMLKAADAAGSLDAALGANIQVLGDASGAAQDFAKNAVESVGLSERAALEASTRFGQLGKIIGLSGEPLAGFSTDLVTLAADMAAFADVSIDEALVALQGAFAGETEGMRRYGVFLDEASLKQTYFAETGQKITGTMTAQQRVLATNAALYAQTADIQGQAAREAGSLARQQDNLKASIENASAQIGKTFLPAITGTVSGLAGAAGAVGRFDEATGGMVGGLVAFSAAGLGLVGVAGKVSAAVGGMSERFSQMSTTSKVALGTASGALALYALSAADAAKDTAKITEAIAELARAGDAELMARTLMTITQNVLETDDGIAESIDKIARQQPGVIARLLEMENATGGVTAQVIAMGGSSASAAEYVSLMEAALANETEAADNAAVANQAAADALSGFDSAGMAAAGVTALASALGAAGSSMGPVVESVAGLGAGLVSATDQANGFRNALELLAGGAIALQASQDALIAGFQGITETTLRARDGQDGFTLAMDQNTAAGRANREMFREQASAILSSASAMLDNGASVEVVSSAVRTNTANLRGQLVQFGMTEAQADSYIRTLGLTPENIDTAIRNSARTAENQASSYNSELRSIPGSRNTNVSVSGTASARSAIAGVAGALAGLRDRTVFVNVVQRGSVGVGLGVGNSASGRFVSGGSNFLTTTGEIPGSAGDEVILPLGNPPRMRQLLGMSEVGDRVLDALVPANIGGSGGSVVSSGVTFEPGSIVITVGSKDDIPRAKYQFKSMLNDAIGESRRS